VSVNVVPTDGLDDEDGAPLPRPDRATVMRACRACGFQFSHSEHGDCCSARCAAYLAAGGLTKADQVRADDPFAGHPERFGSVGQYVACAGCGLTFESRGLRYCPDCYLALGDKDDIKRYGPSVAERPVRRAQCQTCGAPLPMRGGKSGRKSLAIFCSERCRKRAGRAGKGDASPLGRSDGPIYQPGAFTRTNPPQTQRPGAVAAAKDGASPFDPEADAIGSYHDAVRAIGERVHAGEPLPDPLRW